MSAIPNVLAERYATKAIKDLWSPEGKIRLEREYWVAVMKAQKELGLPIPDGVIEDYEKVIPQIDLKSIEERERITRHDVKARLESFNEAAGHEHIHKGMTSRDLTENVEQLQLYRSICHFRTKVAAVLIQFSIRAEDFKKLLMTGRTHNVAAQPTTLGKRLAMFGEELLRAYGVLNHLVETYPARGLKGAVGTQLDQLTLFNGDVTKVQALEDKVVQHLGIPQKLEAVGQVYPRSLDFEVVGCFVQLASGPADFARTLRLMAGQELASEGFAKGQVGSSAMPHKMNARSCERVNGFHSILKGHLAMATSLAGDQWNEGDVSCSVVRRVFLPDACFALDGLLETTLTILKQMEAYPAVIEKENQSYFPFLCTTTLLMESVKKGAGRETAHEAIKEHAVETVRALKSGEISQNDLPQRLASDERLRLNIEEIEAVLNAGETLTGQAMVQVEGFSKRVAKIAESVPEAKSFEVGAIL